MIQIAMIRSDVDTADAFYSEEKDYYNEVLPTISNQETEYRKVLYYSPYKAELEEKIGKVAFKSMELEFKAMDEKLIPLMQEENALTTRYDNLIASAKIDWDGETLNLSLLRPYMTHEDREIRRRAHEKYSAFFQSKAEELDEIYDKLVKNRTAQARLLGYENYVELGYYRMNRNSYGREEVENFRRQIKEYFVPLAERCMREDGNDLVFRSFLILMRTCISWTEIQNHRELRKRSWRMDRRCMRSFHRRQKSSLIL